MKASSKHPEQKETRMNIRVNELQKRIIARAAKIRNTTISHFVLERAYENAQAILAEETHFELPEKQWKEFCKALDRPPKGMVALKKFLSEPDVFDL